MKVLVTGAAGFIGSHLSESIQLRGDRVCCLDNLDASYPRELKQNNLQEVLRHGSAEFIEADICDAERLTEIFLRSKPDAVVHLAARPGVRASIQSPALYCAVNIGGTINVLEAARMAQVHKVVFASSSSVYGASNRVPFREDDPLPRPESPYAGTKAAAEDMCHLFHSLHGLQVQCVRLFTVYGPRQRPDLAVSKFTSSIASGRPVPLYGDGSAARDYTHVSDTVRGILAAVDHASPWDVFNIGSGRTIATIDLIRSIEEAMGRRAVIEHLPPQPGDVPLTFADPDKSRAVLGYEARMPFEQGIHEFADWFRSTEARLLTESATDVLPVS